MATDHDPQYIYAVKAEIRDGKAKLYRTRIKKLTAKTVVIDRSWGFGYSSVIPRESCYFTPREAVAAFADSLRIKARNAEDLSKQLTKTLESIDNIDPEVAHDAD